jgi:hypothetical protein
MIALVNRMGRKMDFGFDFRSVLVAVMNLTRFNLPNVRARQTIPLKHFGNVVFFSLSATYVPLIN